MWLINSHNGTKEKNIPPIQIDEYSIIKKHLNNYYTRLVNRDDQGDTPYNLRNCAYMEDFSRPKLLWAETMRIHKHSQERFPRFGYDQGSKLFVDKTCFFAIGPEIKTVLAILNSLLGRYLCSQYVSILDNGGYLMQKIYLEKIPLVLPESRVVKSIESRIDYLIEVHSDSKVEKELDNIVFDLYGLDADERKFVISNCI